MKSLIINGIAWGALLVFPVLIQAQHVRKACRAGQFYPAGKIELSETVDGYLTEARHFDIKGDIHGIWVPHAGYLFSGTIAANAYKTLKGSQFDVIVLIGPSHTTGIYGGSVSLYHYFESPLGRVPVDTVLAKKLIKKSSHINHYEEAHQYEHSIEVQLPFVQTLFPGVPILAILMGKTDVRTCKSIAKSLHQLTKKKAVLFIASSDMSHYPSYQDAYEIDLRMLDAVQSFDIDKIANLETYIMKKGIPDLQCVLCGSEALFIVMDVCKRRKSKQVKILPYANSGDISGERYRVVGYGAAVFYEKSSKGEKKKEKKMDTGYFSESQQRVLFQIARNSILNALQGKAQEKHSIEDEHLLKKQGVFVTLLNQGVLRGCIGHFGQDTPLYQLVQEMAAAAAVNDYRFAYNPVTVDEMEQIDIKISILSDLHPIQSVDEIEVGKHGIWIKKGNRSGTYLPEVAVDQGWNAKEFAEHCAIEKAGLKQTTWQKDAALFVYTSTVLSEK